MSFKIVAALAVAFSTVVSAAAAIVLFYNKTPVVFESIESRTSDFKAVFNKVSLYSSKNRDVWVMQQSHQGPHLDYSKWDRLAIVVDKTKSPKSAEFYQLEPGEMTFEPQKKLSLKVSCYLCHSNGPRAIRPELNSEVALTLKNRVKLSLWNLKIKTYGRVVADESTNNNSQTPLRLKGAFDNEPLTAKTCVMCHSENGLIARGPLRRQNFMSIAFLVENGLMPPPGFNLSEQEKDAVLAFARGL